MALPNIPRPIAFVLRQVNALFPFLYPARHYLQKFTMVRGVSAYLRDYREFGRLNRDEKFPLRIIDTFPFLYDRYEPAGDVPRHYFHQDLWAARKIYSSRVSEHYDFASRLDGFVAHCLVFCKVHVFDIRPIDQEINGLNFIRSDISNLATVPANSIGSLSSLHAIEHIGLGRYGDTVDPDGYRRALAELQRIVMPGGSLYIGVPIGRERLEFNGHRIFGPLTIPQLMDECDLMEFSAVDDDNRFVQGADPLKFQSAAYSCGLYHFVKRGTNR